MAGASQLHNDGSDTSGSVWTEEGNSRALIRAEGCRGFQERN